MTIANGLGHITRKPHRITVTLPQSTYDELLAISDEQGRSASNLAAFLLEHGLQGFQAGQPSPPPWPRRLA